MSDNNVGKGDRFIFVLSVLRRVSGSFITAG